jgi:hypothetical protein
MTASLRMVFLPADDLRQVARLELIMKTIFSKLPNCWGG